MSNGGDQFQLMDGPDEHQGIHTRDQLLRLIASGQVPPWARILDLQSLQTCTATDLGQPLSVGGFDTQLEQSGTPAPPPPNAESPPLPDVPIKPINTAPSAPQLPVHAKPNSGADEYVNESASASASHSSHNDDSYSTYQSTLTHVVTADPQPGAQWDDYHFEQKIGQGGMGAVYKAKKISTQEAVAIKLLPQELGLDDSLVKRFHREAETLAMIDSPYVSRVIENGQHGNRHFFVMEYVEGTTLSHVIRECSTIPPTKAVAIISQCCQGLWAAGKHGIVHRDIKPGNIMIAKDGTARLMDFGLVLLTRDDHDLTKLTQTGLVIGTVRYLSPEQARGEHCDHRSDIYSIGIVLFEMLTGQLPYQASDVPGMLQHHLKTPAPRPSFVKADIPPHMDRAVLRCLNKDPNGRYQSAMDMVRELENPETLRTGQHSRAQSSTSQAPSSHTNRGLLTILLVVLLLAGTGGVGGWYYLQQQPHPSQPETSNHPASDTIQKENITEPSPKPDTQAMPSALDINELLRNYHIAEDEKNWPAMWEHGHSILKQFPRRAQDARIRLPLTITGEIGTKVYHDEELIGEVPLTVHYKPEDTGRIMALRSQHVPQLQALDKLLRRDHTWAIPHDPAPDIRHADMLPGRPAGMLNTIGTSQAGLTTDQDIYFIISKSNTPHQLKLPQAQGAQLGPAISHGQHLYILYRNQLTVLRLQDYYIRWRFAPPEGSSFMHGFSIGEHELVPGGKKIHLLTDQAQVISIAEDHRGLTGLQATQLPNQASGGPNHIATATGAATLLVPHRSDALLLDSATGTQQHAMQTLDTCDGFSTLQHAAVSYYQEHIPLFLLADQDNQLVAIHAASDVDPSQRRHGRWPLPAAPTRQPVVDANGTTAYVAVDGGDILAIDIRNPGGQLWHYTHDSAAQVSGWHFGPDQIIVAYFDGIINAINKTNGIRMHQLTTMCQLNPGIAVWDQDVVVTTTDGVVLRCTLPH